MRTWELGGQNLLLDRNDPNCARISANLWFSYNPLSWCQTADDATTGQEIKGQRLAVPFWSFLSGSFHFVANCASHGAFIFASFWLQNHYWFTISVRIRDDQGQAFLLYWLGKRLCQVTPTLFSNSFPIKHFIHVKIVNALIFWGYILYVFSGEIVWLLSFF